jgi:hypothetical protein
VKKMNQENWIKQKEKVEAFLESANGQIDENVAQAAKAMISAADQIDTNAMKRNALAGLKALFSTQENSPFNTRMADPPQVVEALEALKLDLTMMWNKHEGLFTIVEVPHGKTGKDAYVSAEDWVQSRLKIYRKRLLAAVKAGVF